MMLDDCSLLRRRVMHWIPETVSPCSELRLDPPFSAKTTDTSSLRRFLPPHRSQIAASSTIHLIGREEENEQARKEHVSFNCVLLGWLALQGLICRTLGRPPLFPIPGARNAFHHLWRTLCVAERRVSSAGTIVVIPTT